MSRFDYDLAVIGGGAGGLTSAGVGASFGMKVVLIEAKKLGGDCTWHGCVPSKTLIRAAKAAYEIRHSGRFGIAAQEPQVDFGAVMRHVRAVRQEIYEDADAPEKYEAMGIEVRQGRARFVDAHTLEVGSERLTARFIVIATGSRPLLPELLGLERSGFLTNETIFEQDTLPERLTVLGGGPIGIELAQAFQRLGSQVSVHLRGDRILPADDPELTALLKARLTSEGVQFVDHSQPRHASELSGDALLIGTGRAANTESLNLEAAGVATGSDGITIDPHCRTSARHIYAVGDVTGGWRFTHMAEHMAKVALSHLALGLPARIETRAVPWVTFTDPELAHIGATVGPALYRFPFSKVDRAITDSETEGWIKVWATKPFSKILGVSILGPHAGDLIAEWALAMKSGLTLRNVADTIHPYPTYGLANRRAADQWYIQSQSVALVKWIQRLRGFQGPLPDLSDKERIV